MVKSRNNVLASATIVGSKGIGQENVARRLLRKAVQRNVPGLNAMIRTHREDGPLAAWHMPSLQRHHEHVSNHAILLAVWRIPSMQCRIPRSVKTLGAGSRIAVLRTT
jgi:hypothetical protein